MQGVNVPVAYKHMIPRAYGRTEDYADDIRRMIESAAGEPIKISDFIDRLGVSSANVHVRRLMKAGKITRSKLHGKGTIAYQYKWHTEPLETTRAALTNGEVITRTLDLPKYPLPEGAIEKLPELAIDWFDTTQPSAEQTAGVLLFRKFVADKYAEIDKQRKAKLEEVL